MPKYKYLTHALCNIYAQIHMLTAKHSVFIYIFIRSKARIHTYLCSAPLCYTLEYYAYISIFIRIYSGTHTVEYLILLLIHTFIFVDLSLSHILIYILRNIFVIRYLNNVHFNFIKMHIGLFILFVVNITLVTIHVILLLYKVSNTYLTSHHNPP